MSLRDPVRRASSAAVWAFAVAVAQPGLAADSAEPPPEPAAAYFRPIAPVEPAGSETGAGAGSAKSGFDWGAASRQAFLALSIQHGIRLASQEKTRKELGGPFFGDYWRSIKGIRGWEDGDSAEVNYIAHPAMGAAAGYIQVQNDPRGGVEFGGSAEYWKSRLRALGFSAIYTAAFEIGPYSEATIGNVGLNEGTNGAVDFVITPTGGFVWMVAEDALDKHVVQALERRSGNRWAVASARCFLNPTRSLARMLQFRPPWRRDGRPLP